PALRRVRGDATGRAAAWGGGPRGHRGRAAPERLRRPGPERASGGPGSDRVQHQRLPWLPHRRQGRNADRARALARRRAVLRGVPDALAARSGAAASQRAHAGAGAQRRGHPGARRLSRLAALSAMPPVGLRRVLGLVEVTAGGVGIIIGAGIYVLLGAATAHAGPLVWVAFLIAAGLSALTGLSYAELSSMFPSAAGEYEYTRQAWPEWVAFVVGWTMIMGLLVAAATVSLGFGRYAGHFVDVDSRAAALALLLAVSVIATLGIKQSARLTLILSAVQVGGLVLVVAIGAPHVGDVELFSGPGAAGVLGAAALVFFAFIG